MRIMAAVPAAMISAPGFMKIDRQPQREQVMAGARCTPA